MLLLSVQIGVLCFHLLAWGAVFHVLMTKRDPRSAFGWSAICLMVPVLGVLLYALFGIGRTQSRASRLMRAIASREPGYAHPAPRPSELENLPASILRMAKPGLHLTGQPVAGGNAITPLVNGNTAYPAMLSAIRQAQRHVFLSTYIFSSGVIADRFVEALKEAHARGCDVRVIIDGVGRAYSLSTPAQKLKEAGVKVAFFLPPKLFPPLLSINLRNHRKVLVCDDTGFTGGMNIADYHVMREEDPKSFVQDMHFLCQGPVAGELIRAFLMDWGFVTGTYDKTLPIICHDASGSCWCRIVLDGPGGGLDPLNDLIAGAISGAEKSVRIMTPYFLPTREIMAALRSAAQKEIDVRIVLPAKNNMPLVHWASLRLMETLLQAGVRIFHQKPPFAHTKLLAIDGYYCQIGSANLDSRSLRLNFELNTEVFSASFARLMEAHIDGKAKDAEEMTLERIQSFSTLQKLRNAACWLFSPYL